MPPPRRNGPADDRRAWISNSNDRVRATVEVIVDETFLDTFLDRR